MNNKGFTLIELVMVTIILGVLAAVAIPRYATTLSNAELKAEKAFVDQIWAGCEDHASNALITDGNEAWPDNPLTVINRTRNVTVTLEDGIPDEDNEWQFSESPEGLEGSAIFHRRPNDDIYYYEYDKNNFVLSEDPVLFEQ